MNISLGSFSGNREERFGAGGGGDKMIPGGYIATPPLLQVMVLTAVFKHALNKNIADHGQLFSPANHPLLKELQGLLR